MYIIYYQPNIYTKHKEVVWEIVMKRLDAKPVSQRSRFILQFKRL